MTSAFDSFIENMDRMAANRTTSFHILNSDLNDFAYRCLPSLKASGLPADHASCRRAIEAGDFTLNGIRISVGRIQRAGKA